MVELWFCVAHLHVLAPALLGQERLFARASVRFRLQLLPVLFFLDSQVWFGSGVQ